MQKYEEFNDKKNKLSIKNWPEILEKVRSQGRLTAEERLNILYDTDTFEEVTPWIKNSCVDFDLYRQEVRNEGVITGYGKIFDRKVYAFSHDGTIMAGAMGEAQGIKICRLIDDAIKTGNPIVGLNDGAGARIQEGVAALNGYCSTFGKISIASGWVPHISVIMGTAAGGTAYAAALTDFIIMVDPISKMFITGPGVIKSVTGEDVTFDELGGCAVHGNKTGTAHFITDSENEALTLTRRLLSFLPSNSKEGPPHYACSDPVSRRVDKIKDIIPDNSMKAFDIKEIITEFIDNGDFLEVHKVFAASIVVGFARLNGETVGIVANQPKVIAGCIDINASWKAARFVQFCDAFNIPIITLADCPGYLPGLAQEHGGIIRNGSKLLFAYSVATVPKITVVVRKDYGGAYSAMCGKGMGADVVLAFPTAELAVMGPDGAASVLFRKEIEASENKEEKLKEMTEQYKERYLNPYRAAEYGIVDDIIDPAELRMKLISHLDMLREKSIWMPFKKHTNIPL